jgi:hypothetical protein
MISHAAETGRKLTQDDVKAVLDMANAVDPNGKAVSENQLTPELESRFWEASSHISNLVKPASAAAIRERSEFLSNRTKSKNNIFSSTIGLYKYYVWAVLAVTLVMHAYYFALGTMVTEAKESIQRFDVARTGAFTAVASNRQNEAQGDSAILISVSNVCTTLNTWRSINEGIAKATLHFSDAEIIESMITLPPLSEKSLCSNTELNLESIAEGLNALRVVDPVTQKALTRGERYRNLIGHFVLPLLYGTLGALAYIVRSLSISIREIRYSRAFHFEYGLQIPLGALAGATVGLIVTPETLNTAFGLTILGLAFGFGYSVDVFFALIDGFIGRLTQREAASQSDSTTKP